MPRRLLIVLAATAIAVLLLQADDDQSAPTLIASAGPDAGADTSTIVEERLAAPATERALISPPLSEPSSAQPATRPIRLKVVGADGGPVAGATVRLYRGERLQANGVRFLAAEAVSDGLGLAMVAGPSETCVATAERNGQQSSWTAVPAGLASDAILELRMVSFISLRGRVESAEGSAVVGSRIRAKRRGGATGVTAPVESRDVVSDADGRFTMQLMPDAMYALVAHLGEQSSADTSVDTSQPIDGEVVLRFARDRTLQGKVFGIDGQPRSAELRIWEYVPPTREARAREPMTARGRSLADGSYSLRLPREGKYLVVASPLRQIPAGDADAGRVRSELNSEMFTLDVTTATTVVEHDFHLSHPMSIAGHVRHADGRPAVDCRLMLVPESSPGEGWVRGPRTDDVFTPIAGVHSTADGAFELTRVQPGTTYRLILQPNPAEPGVSVERAGLIAGSRHEIITLTESEARGARLRLLLVFDDDSSPVPPCRIDYVFYERGEPVSSSPLQVTTEGSLVVSPPLGCGREFGLTIRDGTSHFAEGEQACSPIHIGPIVLTKDEERVVRVPRAVDISVKLLDAQGHPCAGARVALRPVTARATSNVMHVGETDAQGLIRFRGCETGLSRVIVSREGRVERELAVNVQSGLNPGVQVELR